MRAVLIHNSYFLALYGDSVDLFSFGRYLVSPGVPQAPPVIDAEVTPSRRVILMFRFDVS